VLLPVLDDTMSKEAFEREIPSEGSAHPKWFPAGQDNPCGFLGGLHRLLRAETAPYNAAPHAIRRWSRFADAKTSTPVTIAASNAIQLIHAK
jgi:hypothetical protein